MVPAQEAPLEVCGATPFVMHIVPQNSVPAPMISVVQATKIIITTITIITTTIIPAGIRCIKKEIEKVERNIRT